VPAEAMGAVMRGWGSGIAGKALATVAVAGAVLIGQPLMASAAPGPLTITPLGWNVVGLGHTAVTINTGPNKFMVGARVCNTGSDPVANVTATWVWDQANTYVNLDGANTRTITSLAAGACRDAWYVVEVTRNSAAYNTSRDFHVEASAAGQTTVSTPAGREIYVQELVRQNRNSVSSITGPANVVVGDTVTYTINAATSASYEQLATTGVFATSIFEVQSVALTYTNPVGSADQFYVDACGWDNNPASPTYLSCPTAGSAGGTVAITVTAKVIGTGSTSVTAVIYDKSGGSYHYNQDYGQAPNNNINITSSLPPTAPTAVNDTATTNEDTDVDIDVLANDSDINGNLNPSSLSVATQPSNGTASVVGGQVRYSPSPNFSGVDSFTYQICDSTAPTPLCATATVTVTVDPVNDPPTAVDDTDSVDEDSSVTVDVLGNDSDPDDGLDPSSVTVTSGPSNGSTSVNPDGSIDYTPDPDFSGSDSFIYEVCDLAGECDSATVTITVNEVNDPPTALDDFDSVDEDSSVTVDVLGNDSDPDDGLDPGSVTVTSGPANGSTSVNPDGSIDYTPDPDFSGSDSFTYEVCDLAGECVSATVTITVNEVNDPPVAVDDADSVDEDSLVTVDVLGNDSDPDDGLDASSVTVTSGPSNGLTSVNPDGSIDYTPDPDFSGSDSFTYEVCDLAGDCDTATVTITVNEVNDPPTAVDDSDSVDEDSSVTVDVLGNDSDPDDGLDASSVTVTSGPSNGSVSVNPDGSIDYTPDPDFSGSDSLTYEVCDLAGECDTATVDITINPVNDPPTADDDFANVDQDTPTDIDVQANDGDIDGDTLTTQITSPPSNGSVSVNVDGSVRYTPDPGYVGNDSFAYQVCDPDLECAPATVYITVSDLPEPPDAVDDSDSVDEDSSVTVDVLGNDTDPEGDIDPSSVTVTSGPSGGSTSVNPDGSIDYTPDPDFSGTDSFTYEVCDTTPLPVGPGCDTATVTITVNPVNDPPVAVNDSDSVDEDSSVTVDVLGNDSDVDDGLDPTSVNITSGPANGSVSVNPDGSIDYTPDPDFSGSDSFRYGVCDLAGACDTARVDITVNEVNDPPTARNDSDTVDEDSSVTVGVLGNDSDPDDGLDPASVTVTGAPANGSTSVNPDGSIDYTPDPDFFGSDSFTYEVCDLAGDCDTATVDITVTSVNDGPDAVDDTALVDEDDSVTIDVLDNDTDVEGAIDPSTVTVTSGPSNGSTSVNPDGSIDYTPDPDFFGVDSFTYEVCDVDGDCDTATVTVTVSSINDGPNARDDSDTVDEDSSVTVDVLGNDSDIDDGLDPSTITVMSGPGNGATNVNPDGSIDYTPDPGFSGTDSFTYEVCDFAGACDTATVDITVDSVNDPPDAVDDNAPVIWGDDIDIDVLGNDSDPDGSLDPSSVTVTSGPSNGSTTVNPDGSITYVADDNFVGVDSFDYEVCDDGTPTECDTATVTITVSANLGPGAVDDTATVDEDSGPVTIDVLDNDSDPEGGPLTVTSAGPPANGTVTINPDGSIDYTPDPDFSGIDTFTYTVCDVAGNCSVATVTVTVNEVNDAPRARNDSGRVQEGRTITVDVMANDSDSDNALDPASVRVITPPAHGSVTVNADGSIDFTADSGYDGSDSFDYEVCDDGTPVECDSATVSLDIWERDRTRRPNAVDDSATTPEDTPVTINVRGNDTDPDGDPLTVASFSQPRHGSVERDDGRLVFTPDENWNGTTTFTYVVCDPDGRCDDATVTVTVDPVDDAPIANNDAIVVKDGKPVTIPVVDNDDEVDGEPVTVAVVSQPRHGTVTVEADGTVVYTPDEGYDGPDEFRYEICDPDGDCSEATVSVDVQGASQPPAEPRRPSEPEPAPQPGQLPRTGGDVTRLALWGVTLLLMGVALVGRRRVRVSR
jgi:hypothetical protein